MTERPILKNSVVKFRDGWYRVSRKTSTCVNLTGVFNGTILFKNVPLKDMQEDEEAFVAYWQQSERYRSM